MLFQVSELRQPAYLVDKKKKIRVLHCRFDHASNAKIIQTSNLLSDIRNFHNIYNYTKVYNYYQ